MTEAFDTKHEDVFELPMDRVKLRMMMLRYVMDGDKNVANDELSYMFDEQKDPESIQGLKSFQKEAIAYKSIRLIIACEFILQNQAKSALVISSIIAGINLMNQLRKTGLNGMTQKDLERKIKTMIPETKESLTNGNSNWKTLLATHMFIILGVWKICEQFAPAWREITTCYTVVCGNDLRLMRNQRFVDFVTRNVYDPNITKLLKRPYVARIAVDPMRGMICLLRLKTLKRTIQKLSQSIPAIIKRNVVPLPRRSSSSR